jgi:hypothetical protein
MGVFVLPAEFQRPASYNSLNEACGYLIQVF